MNSIQINSIQLKSNQINSLWIHQSINHMMPQKPSPNCIWAISMVFPTKKNPQDLDVPFMGCNFTKTLSTKDGRNWWPMANSEKSKSRIVPWEKVFPNICVKRNEFVGDLPTVCGPYFLVISRKKKALHHGKPTWQWKNNHEWKGISY